MADVARKRLVEAARGLLEQSDIDRNPSGAKFGEALSADFWIWVGHGSDDAADSGCDHCIGAGAGSTLVGTRLKIDVKGCAKRARASLLDGENLCMFDSGIGMKASSNDRALLVYDDRAYLRIG